MRYYIQRLLCAVLVGIYVFTSVSLPAYAATDLDSKERELIQTGSNFYWPYEPVCSAAGAVSGTDGSSLQPGAKLAQVKQFIWDYLTSPGRLTPEQAAGVMGNMQAESRFDPIIVQGGSHASTPAGISGGWGLVQWTPGTKILPAIANDTFNRIAGDVGLQLDILWAQLTDANNVLIKGLGLSEISAGTKLRAADGVAAAAITFLDEYERAAATQLGLDDPRRIAQRNERIANANAILAEFGSSGPVGVGPTSGTSVGCAGAVGAGFVGFPIGDVTKQEIADANPGCFKNNTTCTAGHPYTAYDILAPTGKPILAVLAGEVVHIGEDRCPGKLVSVYSPDQGVVVSYLHLSRDTTKAAVAEGDQVQAGAVVGYIGTTQEGCTVPHLHIDASTGDTRPGCSRLNCPVANRALFKAGNDKINLGGSLYQGWLKLP